MTLHIKMKPRPDTLKLAVEILQNYFSSTFKIEEVAMGNANANYIVESEGVKYFFRIYLPVKDFERDTEVIKKELDVIGWFKEKGFPVAKAIPSLSGELITHAKDTYAVLFEYLKGRHIYGELRAEHFKVLGQLMGKVHVSTEEENQTCDKSWPDGNFWKRIFRKVEENRTLLTDDELNIYSNLKNKPSLLESVPQYLIHGDYHFGNILFDENNSISGLLDFDDYRMGHFMDDCVRSFMCELHYTPEENHPLQQEQVKSFWDGYRNERELSKGDVLLIPLYIDLHYLSGIISQCKRDTNKADTYQTRVKEFRKFINLIL